MLRARLDYTGSATTLFADGGPAHVSEEEIDDEGKRKPETVAFGGLSCRFDGTKAMTDVASRSQEDECPRRFL